MMIKKTLYASLVLLLPMEACDVEEHASEAAYSREQTESRTAALETTEIGGSRLPVEDASCSNGGTFFDPPDDALSKQDVVAAMPLAIRELASGVDQVMTAPDATSNGDCISGPIKLPCHDDYFGCASCFEFGQPRRRINSYSKYIWCDDTNPGNGQPDCSCGESQCFYDFSYCTAC